MSQVQRWAIVWGVFCGLASGCGGASPTRPVAQSPQGAVEGQFNPLGDLLSQAQSALTELEDPAKEAEAVTRFVILTPQSLPRNEANFESLVGAHFKLTTQALTRHKVNKIAISKLIDRFSVTHLSTQDELPINLEALSGSTRQRQIKLNELQGLTFVSYQGRALRAGLQIHVSCEVTARLTDSPLIKGLSKGEVWVASLSTLEVLTPQELSARCADSAEHWVRPGAELVEGGVRLVTRGLNQWGRPELELGPLSRDEAPQRYPFFREVMELVRSGAFPQGEISSRDQKAQLTTCLRPSHHYETTCRRVVP